MLRYTLFGQAVTFDDAAERFFDLQFASWRACTAAEDQFNSWYKQCKDIESVLNQYEGIAQKLLGDLAFQPLFAQLPSYGLYDVSQESYWNRCISFENAASAEQVVEEKYLAILRKNNAEKEYRQARKDNRGRWQGGGFGMSGALKGAAQAATLNAVAGLGHSAVNAIGNAGSALSASLEKGELYRDSNIKARLLDGITSDLTAAFNAHRILVNNSQANYFRSAFNSDKSSALFTNAQKLPEKRQELLVQAVQLCPWNEALIRYIFVNFPDEREPVCAIAQRFYVDLSACMEDMLAREYTALAHSSETAALAARDQILQLMQEYRISESATLDQLETDCLQRLLDQHASNSKPDCDQLIATIKQYPAQDRLKLPFIQKVEKRIDDIWTGELNRICQSYGTADESTCEQMISAVKHHEARDELKAPFLSMIQKRIETIWAAEDGEIFDNLYLKTDVYDSNSIAEATAYIQSKGRTASSKQYLDALAACTPKMIKRARSYKYSKLPTVYLILALISLATCLVGAAIIGVPLAILFFVLRGRLKKAWNVLTIDGKVIHPVLAEKSTSESEAIPEQDQEDTEDQPQE